MRIILECQTVVAEILDVVSGLGHGPEREQLDGIIFRRILGCGKQGIELSGYILSIVCRTHLIAEIAYEITQVLYLFLIRLVMHTIYEGLCRPAPLGRSIPHSLTSRSHKFRHTSVGKEHKFLDKPVGLLGHLLIHIHRASLFVDLHLHFRALEAYGPGGKPLLAKLGGKTMKGQNSLLDLLGNALMRRLRTAFDYSLSLFV